MLAVFAPYDRTEICASAIRVAELALSTGQRVRYLTADRCYRGVHPYWDSQVRSLRRHTLVEQGRGVTHAVWFAYGECLQAQLSYVGNNVRHFYVPSYHNMHLAEWRGAACAHHVVYPTHYARQVGAEALSLVRQDGELPRQSVCSWASGLRPYERRPRAALDPRVLFYCDTNSVDDCAPLVCRVVAELARRVPNSLVHLLSSKTWSRRDRKLLRDLCAVSGGRVTHAQQRGMADLLTLLMEVDWLVLPGVRANFGGVVRLANAFGVPVVCYDVDPFSEVVQDGVNGLLVPCETHSDALGVLSAVPSAAAFANRLVQAIDDVRLYNRLRQEDWQLEQVEATFRDFWMQQLNLGDAA